MIAQWPVVLIGGVPRSGKSRISRKIAPLTGFGVVHCDQFRQRFWSIEDEQERSSQRYRCYEQVIAARRQGLIIEGDDLIFRNRGDTALARQGLINNDTRLTLDLMRHLQARTGANAFVVGCIEADPEATVAAIRRHETEICFTRALADDGLKGFVRTSIRRSEILRTMAAKAQITYLEVGIGEFDAAVELATRRILHEIDWPERKKTARSLQ